MPAASREPAVAGGHRAECKHRPAPGRRQPAPRRLLTSTDVGRLTTCVAPPEKAEETVFRARTPQLRRRALPRTPSRLRGAEPRLELRLRSPGRAAIPGAESGFDARLRCGRTTRSPTATLSAVRRSTR